MFTHACMHVCTTLTVHPAADEYLDLIFWDAKLNLLVMSRTSAGGPGGTLGAHLLAISPPVRCV